LGYNITTQEIVAFGSLHYASEDYEVTSFWDTLTHPYGILAPPVGLTPSCHRLSAKPCPMQRRRRLLKWQYDRRTTKKKKGCMRGKEEESARGPAPGEEGALGEKGRQHLP
jgi:hypothetical protein